MPRALVLGGTGATGRAIARRLRPAGWDVVLAGRDPGRMPADLAAAGTRFVAADRSDLGTPAEPAGLAGQTDLLVDCLCFGAADAAGLLPLARRSACTVMISAKAVYADDAGRHASSAEPPDFGGPVTESQATLPPGDQSYPNGKVAAERLLDSGLPVTVLRPGLIHGEGARQPREWIFVKRALDRRPRVLLAHRGAGVNQTTAAANLAALIEVVAGRPGQRILNAADPDPPSARQISRTVAGYLGHERDEVLLDGSASETGRLPWDVPHPVVLDTAAATALGYRPAGDYAATVSAEVDWLVRAAAGGPEADLVQGLEQEFWPLLDYAAEDRYLERRGGPGGVLPPGRHR
ncbi:MAG: NAD-dependent epimerase/dehydratase family protein [Streptosporangiaceae bacterium]